MEKLFIRFETDFEFSWTILKLRWNAKPLRWCWSGGFWLLEKWLWKLFMQLSFCWDSHGSWKLDHTYSLPSEPSMDSSRFHPPWQGTGWWWSWSRSCSVWSPGCSIGGSHTGMRLELLKIGTLETRFDSKDSLHMKYNHWWYMCSMEVKNLVTRKALPEKQLWNFVFGVLGVKKGFKWGKLK